jgi:hypothetical protein
MYPFENWEEMYPSYEQRMRRKGGGNPNHDKSGKFASSPGSKAPTQGVLKGNKVTIQGKQYGVGDSIQIKGKEHHVAEITSSKVTIKPGPYAGKVTKASPPPASIKRAPVTKTATKTTVQTKRKNGKDVAEYPTRTGHTKDVPVTKGRRMTKAEYLKKAPPRLSASETAALKMYVDGDGHDGNAAYKTWNRHLRHNFDATAKEKTDIKVLTNAINKHSVPEDVVVTRRVGLSALGITKERGKAAPVNDVVGRAFVDKGFTSTTLMDDIDGVDFDNANIKMNIHVPKGTKGMLVNVPRPNGVDEQELLFPPGLKYTVREATKGAGREWTLEVDLLP